MENNIHICDTDKAALKQKTLSYLPRNLGEPEAHRQILTTIAAVVPEIAFCIEKTDMMIWPKTQTGEMSINQAIAQCAYETNASIGAATVNMQNLQAISEEALMKAWIALDYYSYVLKADYSVHIRNLQDRISGILLHAYPVNEQAASANNPQPTLPNESANVNSENQPQNPQNPVIKDDPKPQPIKPPQKPSPQAKTNKKGKAPIMISVLVLVLILGIVLAFLLNGTRKAEVAIRKIGTVTLDSEEEILKAEELFDNLKESQQEKVDNLDVLIAARAEFDRLVVEDAIDQIGTVTMNSKDAIEHAEKLYEALSREARNLVENYKTLTAARKEYTRLETAIKEASDAIDAIGTVTLESGSDIEAARSAYDALEKDNLQSHLSHKASILTNAENEYEQLVCQNLYDTGTAYANDNNNQAAIDCFDTILTDYADSSLAQDARNAKANCQIALAKESYGKKDYYTATIILDEVDASYRNQENYQTLNDQILAALKKNRPKNAAKIGGSIGWGQCYFKITAGNQDVCFKFQNTKDPTKFKMVYVRAGQSTKVNIKDGNYYIKYATGDYWYDKDHLFGPDTVYKSKGTVEFTTTRSGNWIHYWYLELDMTSPSFSSTSINANDF